jgi:hypothetical protein
MQPWLLENLVHLHNALNMAAIGISGEGQPLKLHASSRVVSADASAATIILEDGRKASGDLVIRSDDDHSATRKSISCQDIKPHGSGKSTFLFLISRKAAQDSPIASKFCQKSGELNIVCFIQIRNRRPETTLGTRN